VPNTQVTHDTDVNNARSESSLAINPNNPMQMVAASKRFTDIHTYDFTLATEYSVDGGVSWTDSAPLQLVGFTVMTDPTMAWDDQGNVFLVGLSGQNPPTWDAIGIVVYKSTDGGKTWSAPKPIHTSTSDDKQWVAGDSNPASPFHGRVYAVWDDVGGIDFARTLDHGGTWVGPGPGATAAGGVITSGSVFPEINVGDDGTVYVVTIAGSQIQLHVSTDGGDTFTAATAPATGITTLGAGLPQIGGFPVFPGGNFRVITDPTACAFGKIVTVAWADFREGVSRIYFARSVDGGATWVTGPSGKPLLTTPVSSTLQQFHPQIVTDPNGVIGCSFYEFGPKPTTSLIDVIVAQSFDGGVTFTPFTVTDQPWNPTVDAPWSHGNSSLTFIGDYMGLDASLHAFYPLWTDTRTGIQELFTARVPERVVGFIVNRSTLGEDEVDARRKLAGGANAIIPDTFRVTVDGFSAAQVGVTSSSSTLTVASPTAGMTVTCLGNVADTGSYGPDVQRFTFLYQVDFGSNPNDPAFNFPGQTKFLTLHASAGGISGSAQIELIKQPNPFILHGDPAWLSIDLRVFTMRPNDQKFGVTMGAGAASAPDFIQHVTRALTQGGGSANGQSFDDPSVLSPDEDGSRLYVHSTDENSRLVFNFALARVRYVGLIGATDVRVFFRLFQAQTTNGTYDFPPGAHYRRAASNPNGQPIPLAGIQGSEYVTMPFFALPRVDTTVKKMDKQTDSHTVAGHVLGNVQHIVAHQNGSEVDTFFGCWLDMNQPSPNVLPATVDAMHPDGPYQSMSNPPLTLQQAVLKNLHQCLIAEVAFDPVVIPLGKDPSNWDKLAQRNIAWSDVGSATAVTTFEIRPTPVAALPGQPVDELMIDWGDTPASCVARVYLPGVSADEILSLAARMYLSQRLTKVDAHTLECAPNGITYIPVPRGTEVDFAGLLTLDTPAGLRHGHEFSVVVRQVTNAFATTFVGRDKADEPVQDQAGEVAEVAEVAEGGALPISQEGVGRRSDYSYSAWRRVLGAFQLTVPVRPKQAILAQEERALSTVRWISQSIPGDSRWFPVFQRYVDVLGTRVRDFGGDPTKVLPSPTGDPHGHHDGDHDHGDHDHGDHDHGDHDHDDHDHDAGEERVGHTGKVGGLVFDRFGDFEGFVLVTDEHERRYFSRESEVEALAERAWQGRLRVTVFAERDEPTHASSIVVWEPPVAL
jgi:BNR/Asp-box repeat